MIVFARKNGCRQFTSIRTHHKNCALLFICLVATTSYPKEFIKTIYTDYTSPGYVFAAGVSIYAINEISKKISANKQKPIPVTVPFFHAQGVDDSTATAPQKTLIHNFGLEFDATDNTTIATDKLKNQWITPYNFVGGIQNKYTKPTLKFPKEITELKTIHYVPSNNQISSFIMAKHSKNTPLAQESPKSKTEIMVLNNELATLLRKCKNAPKSTLRHDDICIQPRYRIKPMIFDLIQNNSIEWDWKSRLGETFLHLACEACLLKIVPQVLSLSHKENIDLTLFSTNNGKLPLQITFESLEKYLNQSKPDQKKINNYFAIIAHLIAHNPSMLIKYCKTSDHITTLNVEMLLALFTHQSVRANPQLFKTCCDRLQLTSFQQAAIANNTDYIINNKPSDIDLYPKLHNQSPLLWATILHHANQADYQVMLATLCNIYRQSSCISENQYLKTEELKKFCLKKAHALGNIDAIKQLSTI